jgi:6-phosphofructokinase
MRKHGDAKCATAFWKREPCCIEKASSCWQKERLILRYCLFLSCFFSSLNSFSSILSVRFFSQTFGKGAKINAESVKTELEKTLKIEARITVLGHIQRGGTTSAFDRYQGTVLGVAAIDHFANRNDSVGEKG